MTDEHEDWTAGELRVVVNDQGQYSIWPVDRDLPAGWHPAGREGSKEECLAFIEDVWTTLRPTPLRRESSG